MSEQRLELGGSIPVSAVAFDRDMRLDRLEERAGEVREVLREPGHRAWVLPGGERLHVYAFGAAVMEGARHIPESLLAWIEAGTGTRCLPVTEEQCTVEPDPEGDPDRPRLGWDRVLLQTLSREALDAVSLLLGQSAALERHERAVHRLMEEALAAARDLERRGRIPRSFAGLPRQLARITGDRIQITRHIFVEDRPDSTWDDPRVWRLYEVLHGHLEIRERYRALERKLAAVESTVGTLSGLWHTRRALFLEGSIVALIVLEVVLALGGWW